MKTYEVKKTVRITVQPGSTVILTDQQAVAVGEYVEEVKKKPTKKE